MIEVVLDTNVIVAAVRSRNGASYRVLRALAHEPRRFRPCLSVPLVLEYETALRRKGQLNPEDVDSLLDYLCQVGNLREIYFLWRPFLKDPSDEMVLEVGVEANAEAIVTHNVRDFKGVEERFGIRVIRPGAFLLELEERGP